MPLTVVLQSTCDQAIAALLDLLATVQERHLAATGHYCQLLYTHSTPPSDGKETAPDMAAETGEGIASSWVAVRQSQVTVTEGPAVTTIWRTADVKLPATLPCALSVDTYDAGDAGKGWVLCALVTEKGTAYRRCVSGAGPEARDVDWTAMGAVT